MTDISELDETAQRLKVSWRKANNFYRSFATILLETKRQIETGAYGPEWTFSGWLLKKAGLFEPQVMTQLKVFARVIAADERAEIEQANIEIAVRKRAEKRLAAAQAAQRKNERAIARAHKEREQAALRAEKEAQKLAAEIGRKQAADEQKQSVEEKQKAERQEAQRLHHLAHMKQRRDQLKANLSAGPENPELVRLLARAVEIETSTRPQLGEVYLAMKEIVDTHQAGKNADGKFWTWTGWTGFYIKRSRQDIHKCIQEYVASDADRKVIPLRIVTNG